MSSDDPDDRLPLPDPAHAASEPVEDAEATALDPVIQAHIGRELKSLFNDIALEPVPDRFLDLLRRLDDRGSAQS